MERIPAFIAPISVLVSPLIKDNKIFNASFITPTAPSTILLAPFHALFQSPVNIPVIKSIKPSNIFHKFPITPDISLITSIIVFEIFLKYSESLSINPSIIQFTNGFKNSQIFDITRLMVCQSLFIALTALFIASPTLEFIISSNFSPISLSFGETYLFQAPTIIPTKSFQTSPITLITGFIEFSVKESNESEIFSAKVLTPLLIGSKASKIP